MHGQARGEHRLDSFVGTAADLGYIDLRSAALPGLPIVSNALVNLDSTRLRSLVTGPGYLPEGLPELREKVAEYYSEMDLPTTADQILITSGAQQRLRVLVRATLETRTPVLIEEPSFRGAIETLRSEGARLRHEFAQRAVQQGVSVLPGPTFSSIDHLDEHHPNQLRRRAHRNYRRGCPTCCSMGGILTRAIIRSWTLARRMASIFPVDSCCAPSEPTPRHDRSGHGHWPPRIPAGVARLPQELLSHRQPLETYRCIRHVTPLTVCCNDVTKRRSHTRR